MVRKMNAAIVGLIRGYRDLQSYYRVIRRNRLLHKNFNARYGYPVILFHEGNIAGEHRDHIAALTPNVEFVDVGASDFSSRPETDALSSKDLGYRNMCRFYSLGIYDHLTDFDYVMRLDDDSYLESKIGYDIFEYMLSNNFDYGYIHSEFDSHVETIETLPNFVLKYIEKNQIKINCDLLDIDCLHYYSNFHITRIGFWLRSDVRDFLKAIDEDGGIYRHRWGDHVIQTLALKMFSDPTQLHCFTDFRYTHYSHRWSNYEWGWKQIIDDRYHKFARRLRRRVTSFLHQ